MNTPVRIIMLVLVILCGIAKGSWAQDETKIVYETREMVINYDDTITRIHIFVANPTIKPDAEMVYTWYQKQTVLQTRGSWSGKLLHGKYETFYPNHNLLEQGYYENGHRVGAWSRWYADGEIAERINWKKGIQHGTFEQYDDKGNMTRRGKYRKGFVHGTVHNYVEGQLEKERYKKGKLQLPKEDESSVDESVALKSKTKKEARKAEISKKREANRLKKEVEKDKKSNKKEK